MENTGLSFKYELEKKTPRIGAGHYIKNTGTKVCRILIGFNSGHYEAIDLSEWLAGNPKDVIETNFGVHADLTNKLPQRKLFAVPAKSSQQ
ncbi:hypothetical protein [Dyadobacter sp. CY312]|uniref:hypothetical protein n=1 Tax=Dyadobacter sp. CY312 TaxID=2907303 RepID=UPI001F3E7D18|nr:hypothetical protein [Dyadobacter sp. CY312]MCE7042500.1 hypothetical protein [Dyadobacter sp. CY312]